MKNTEKLNKKAESIDVPYFDTCVELAKYVTLNTKTTWVYYKHRTEEDYKLELFKTATDNNFGTTKELNIIPAPTFTELVRNTDELEVSIGQETLKISFTTEKEVGLTSTENNLGNYHFSEVVSNFLINNIIFNFKDV